MQSTVVGFRLAGLIMLLCCSLLASADPPFNALSTGWRDADRRWLTTESEHFRIHYLSGNEEQAAWAAAVGESAHTRLAPEFRWQPRDKTELVLTDDYDLANGWATAWPFNQSRLYLSSPDDLGTLENSDDWLTTLITHEYTHVLHLDKAEGAPLGLRRFFGRMPLLFPNQFQPTFLVEGLAIRYESDAATETGRAYSALYEGMMRAQVNAGARDLNQVTVTNRRWPSGDGYLYGAFFYRYLADTYGDQAVQNYIDHYSDNLLPFALNSTAQQVFGKDFRALWQEYQTWLRQNFSSPSPSAEIPPGAALTQHGLDSQPPVARGEYVYRIASDGHGPAHLMRYHHGNEPTRITRVRDAGLFDVDEREHVLMARLTPRRENRLWSDLYLYDGRWHRITRDGRYREARWLGENRLLARRQQDGRSALLELDTRGKTQRLLWQGEPGETLGTFTIAPDHSALVAAYKPAGRSWQLARIDLRDGTLSLLTDNGSIQSEPVLTADGTLLFSADYDGHFNLYRMSPAGIPEAITHSSTGAFTPAQTSDGRLYYQHLGANGYDLWQTRASNAPLSAAAPRPARNMLPPDAVALTEARPYRATSLRPRWWFPVASVTADSVQAGAMTSGSDALGQHAYALTLVYETRSEEPAGQFSYLFSNRYQFLLGRSLSFSTEDDDVSRVRASDTVALSRLNLWNAFDDKLGLHAGLFHERDSDRYRTAAANPRRTLERGLAGAALVYDNSQRFRYSISPAAGRQISLIAESNEVLNSDYSGEIYSLDWREYMHLGNSHVLALRAAGAWGTDSPKPIRLSDQAPGEAGWFGRDRYLLRGYADDEIFGRRVAVGSAEWRFPLARVQRNWHTYPLGVRDLHGALFTDTGAAWSDVDYGINGKQFTGVGAELTTELVLGYQLVLPVRVGVARGLDDDLGETRAYLSLGAAF